MDEIFPALLALQGVAALSALGLTLNQWLAMRAASQELKEKLSRVKNGQQEIERLLADLSQAESDGVQAMETALEQNQTEFAKAFRELEGAKRTVILKALTQPSDRRRKQFCYNLTPLANP